MNIETLEDFIYCNDLHIPARITCGNEEDKEYLENNIFEHLKEHVRNSENTHYNNEHIYETGYCILTEYGDGTDPSTIQQVIYTRGRNKYNYNVVKMKKLKPYLMLSVFHNYGEHKYYKYFINDFENNNMSDCETSTCIDGEKYAYYGINDYMVFV